MQLMRWSGPAERINKTVSPRRIGWAKCGDCHAASCDKNDRTGVRVTETFVVPLQTGRRADWATAEGHGGDW